MCQLGQAAVVAGAPRALDAQQARTTPWLVQRAARMLLQQQRCAAPIAWTCASAFCGSLCGAGMPPPPPLPPILALPALPVPVVLTTSDLG